MEVEQLSEVKKRGSMEVEQLFHCQSAVSRVCQCGVLTSGFVVSAERVAHMNSMRTQKCTIAGCGKVGLLFSLLCLARFRSLDILKFQIFVIVLNLALQTDVKMFCKRLLERKNQLIS